MLVNNLEYNIIRTEFKSRHNINQMFPHTIFAIIF